MADVDTTGPQAALNAFLGDEDLQDLCEANGVSKEEFVTGRHRITFLEYFLSPSINMEVIAWFPMLQELQLIHCGIERIHGLERCPNLERLWLNENNLRAIGGLGRCTKLRELYLYGNELARLEGLDQLLDLEVLWLMENRLRAVEGLQNCGKLRVLWLASNAIESVHGCLDNQLRLEDLNLAGNRIGSFHDIPYLDKLPSLRSVTFSDPHFGSNPVCQLCNYQTYAVHHLRRVTKLDCMLVSDEQRHLAEATFAKKKMYYNMRIKTLKRNTTNLLKKGLQFTQSKKAEVGAPLPALYRAAKALQHHAHVELEGGLAAPNSTTAGPLLEVTTWLDRKQAELQEIEELYAEMRNVVQVLSVHQISRFVVELQSGGNIRLEEGKPSDMWFRSCVDLVKSRFYAEDFQALGLKDIKILKVTRIHNRALRNRFEEELGALMDPADALAKRSLEYLFHGQDPAGAADLLRALQHGFRAPEAYEAPGQEAGVPLTNSVFLCEEPRLRAQLAAHQATKPRRKFDGLGQFLIAKVFLGTAAPEADGGAWLDHSGLNPARRPRRAEYGEGVDSVYRCKAGDPKQRVWFAFDARLVLPEYLVECVYEPLAGGPGPGVVQDIEELSSVIAKLTAVRSDVDLLDMKVFAYPFVTFMQACNVIASRSPEGAPRPPAALREPPQVTELTMEAVQAVTRCHDVPRLTYLNLLGSPLRSMAPVAHIRMLRVLVLAFTGLQRVEGVAGLPVLERLDLSFNSLRRLEGLKDLPSLTTLDLAFNRLHRLDDVDILHQCAPSLHTLLLLGNELCEAKGYRGMVIQALPTLESLDGRSIPPSEREAVGKAAVTITPELLLTNAAFQLGSQGSGVLAPISSVGDLGMAGAFLNVADALDDGAGDDVPRFSAPPVGLVGPNQPQLYGIVSLNLSRLRIQKIQHLDGLRNLRRLNMSDNEIARIEGLEMLYKLEELCLEDNRIQAIEGLQNLPHLRRLELGKNKITAIEGLQGPQYLCQLSLEDNDITSCQGLEHLMSLMELYMNNNKVESVKETNHLRELEKLIILDLSGNPMCKDPEYRLYTVYQLKKLKVFDGTNVDATETALAKEMFTGKMTPELLAERVGSSLDWAAVTELTLSHCGLKELALLGQFRSLAVLKADHNLLPDLKGLENCVALRRLDVSFNRLKEALDPRDPPQRNPVGRYLLGLPLLDTLVLDGNGIPSIGSLQLQLPALTSLSLRQNEVTRLSGLGFVPHLQQLSLDKNKLRSLEGSALAAVPRLIELRVEENHVRSLEGLGTAQSLRRLSLVSNRLVEAGDLDHIEPLEDLEEVWLMGNSLARKPHYRYLLIARFAKLTHLDGKEVTPEERERAKVVAQAQTGDGPYGAAAVLQPLLNTLPPAASLPLGAMSGPPIKPTGALKVSTISPPEASATALLSNVTAKAGLRGRAPVLRPGPSAGSTPTSAALPAGTRRPPGPLRGVALPATGMRSRTSPRPSGTSVAMARPLA